MPRATFYFDLGSPYAYLTAERLHEGALPASPVWQPVSLGALFKLNGRSSWARGLPADRQAGMTEVQERAHRYGLAPVRWPEPWPSNYLYAMRAATFASRAGQGPPFALSAFRRAFVEGHDLAMPEHVLAAAEQVGLDPQRVDEATQDPEIKLALRTATDVAHQAGVFGVPTVVLGEEVFWGDDRLEEAVVALRRQAKSG